MERTARVGGEDVRVMAFPLLSESRPIDHACAFKSKTRRADNTRCDMSLSSFGLRIPFTLAIAGLAACSAGSPKAAPPERPPVDDGLSSGLLGGGPPPP